MKKQFFSLLALCAFSAVTFAGTGEVAKDAEKKGQPGKTEVTTPKADDDFWICREVSRIIKMDPSGSGAGTVTVTYECSWWTLAGPGTPPPGNLPGPGNGIPKITPHL